MKQVFSSKDFEPDTPKKTVRNRVEVIVALTGKKARNLKDHYFPKPKKATKPIAHNFRPNQKEYKFNHNQEFTIKSETPCAPNRSLPQKMKGFFNSRKRKIARGGVRKHKPWKQYSFVLLKIFGVMSAVGIIFIIGVFIYFSKDLPAVGKVNSRFVAESTKIYDRTGTILLYDIHGEEKRTIIPSTEIPQTIKDATIALEDHDFYNHHGIKFTAIARAALSQVFGIGTRSGGSTITQQLIKNSILTSERSIARKIKEAILAIELEFTSSKEEILELYLNEIPYGSNAYGIEAAAETFFDKNARDLTYDEAAVLAALPQAPSRYSPYGLNQELLKGRQERALDEMATLGFISAQDAAQYKEVDVLAKIAKNTEQINAPHFVFYVRDYLEEKYGAEYLEKNGLTIKTTLDWDKQVIAQRIVKEKALENKANFNAENASLVAIDPKTGEILAMVGSRDYFDEEIDGQVNVALSERQPGSSFKPYVFLQSFIEGYTPETILFDVETAFPTDRAPDYEPKNYDGTFRGPTKIKDALALSLNIPAVKALYLVGLNDVLDFTQALGITTLTDPDRYGLSLVLGGGEVTLLDHTSAFSVFANNGIRKEKVSIVEITDRENKVLESFQESPGDQVVEKKYVDMLSHILSTNSYREPAFGANNPLRFDDRPVAAKTGTTNENRDAWTMGYTPEVAIGIWGGNNDNSSMNNRGVGANVAAPIFREFLLEAYPEKGKNAFGQYDSKDVKTNKDIIDGTIPEVKKIDVCEISRSDQEYCKENSFCPEDSKKERAFVDIHNILHFVNKDDPRGENPKNPQSDPFYEKWEVGVRDYYKDQDDTIFDEQPRSCRADDFPDQKPQIRLDVKVSGSELDIEVDGDIPFDAKQYIYFINGKQVAAFEGKRFKYQLPPELNNTTLEIKVELTDILNNKASSSIKQNISF